MGGDRVPGPLSRFIPPIDEYLEARLKVLATSARKYDIEEDPTGTAASEVREDP